MNQYFAFNKFHKFCLALAMGFSLFGLSSCGDSDDKNPGGISISDKTVSGVSQKGPFVKGSSVHVYELDLNTLAQTGNSYTGKIASDKGDFKVNIANLASQYALLEAEGYYRNEITGKLSSSPITLNAITDLSDRDNVNINLLTHLEFERVLYLTQNGMSVRKAKAQAEQEILKSFYVDANVVDFEDLNIFNGGEGSAALLAISVLMQGNRSEAVLSELLANYAQDIEEDGTWDDESSKTEIADWSEAQTLDIVPVCDVSNGRFEEKSGLFYCNHSSKTGNRFAQIRLNVESWNQGSVSDYEKFAVRFWWNNYGLGECNEKRQGEIAKNQNKKSKNSEKRYVCDEKMWRNVSVKDDYVCDESLQDSVFQEYMSGESLVCDKNAWRPLEYVEEKLGFCKETKRGVYERIREYGTFICLDSGWTKCPESGCFSFLTVDEIFGTCSDEKQNSIVKMGDEYDKNPEYYVCQNNEWTKTSKIAYENGACTELIKDSVVKTEEDWKLEYYICQNSEWTKTSQIVYENGLCTDLIQDSVVKIMDEDGKRLEYYVCQNSEWTKTSKIAYENGACTELIRDSVVKTGEDWRLEYYICQNNEWTNTTQTVYEHGVCTELIKDSVVKTGSSYYVCQNNEWTNTTQTVYEHGVCTELIKDSVVKTGSSYYICQNNEWTKTTRLIYENGLCTETKQDSVVKFTDDYGIRTEYYVCQNNEWTKTTQTVYEHGVCTELIKDSVVKMGSSYYVCQNNEWKNTTRLIYENGVCTEIIKDSVVKFTDDLGIRTEYYVCQNNEWTKTTQTVYENGVCTELIKDSVVKTGSSYYVCQNSEWKKTTQFVYENGVCTELIQDSIIKKGTNSNPEYYICQNNEWKKMTVVEYENGFCTVDRNGEIVDNQYVCQNKSWRELNVIEKEDGLCIGSRKGDVIEFVYGAPSLNLGYNIAHSDEYICKNGSCRDNWLYYLECDGESWKFTSKNIYEQYVWTKALGECSVEKNEQVVEYQESVSEGNLVTWNTVYYACVDLKWRVATKLEYTHGVCNSEKTNETIKFDNKYFGCSENNWKEISELESIVIPQQGFCQHEINQKNVDVNGKSIVCEAPSGNGFWREKTDVEIANDMCSLSRQDEITNYDEQVYMCKSEHWVSIDKLGLYELPQEVFFNPDIEYGTLTDARDGNVYKTVQVGTQEWMAENLRIDAGIHSGCYSERNDSKKYCQLGRMYSADVMDVLCPDGWHLPNGEEWETLIASVDDKSELLSSHGWEKLKVTNVNKSGFSIVPMAVDWSFFNGADSWSEGPRTFFWSFSENLADRDIPIHAFVGDSEVGFKMDLGYTDNPERLGFYVRCVKDSAE